MELPIDHFRLIGVSPSAETEAVLRALQVRLDRFPEQGFTEEVLIQRAELLRLSADLLTDKELRNEYEAALLGGAVGLELSSNREVAGLILLWEADASLEAFQLATKALRPPQAPALGSGREADLTLVAALACRAASLQEQEQRHYAAASQLLQEGIQLLQRMGKLQDQRKQLELDLDALIPYRILDLVSRDVGDEASHEEGVRALDSFVLKRGGIEGRKVSKTLVGLEQPEFELFFQQIRKFLTVQEQTDLFLSWQRSGSEDAGFLGVLSLTAAGFSRRKPELVQEARRYLKSLNLQGIDPMPIIGCMDLLLADVDLAYKRFKDSPDQGLKNWLADYPGETLGALCDYCRDWLRRDVLPGYRDVETEVVDLEAWFEDRDVQSYVEALDRKGAIGFAKAGFSFLSSFSPDSAQSGDFIDSFNADNDSPVQEELQLDNEIIKTPSRQKKKDFAKFISALGIFQDLQENHLLCIKGLNLNKRSFLFTVSSLILVSLVTVMTIVFFGLRSRPFSKDLSAQNSSSNLTISIDSEEGANLSSQEIDSSPIFKADIELLTEKEPTKEQILFLLQAWLANKASVLSGGEVDVLSKVARSTLVKRVQSEREKDIAAGEIQTINAKVLAIELISQTPKRIEIKAKLSYNDKRLDSSGEILSETTIPNFNVTYVFGRENNVWQLVDYMSGS